MEFSIPVYSYRFNGSKLREAREAKGLRREHLAIVSGRVVRTIELYETGQNEPNISTAYALARALGVEVIDLLEEC